MNPLVSSLRVAALCLAFSIAPGCFAVEAVFKAGAARRDITPKEPVPMWGYGARRDTLGSGALDPLHADVVVLDAGGTKLAIVGLDLGRSPSEKSLQNIRARIKAEAGIEHSFIAGSHTHHGPVLELSDEDGKGRGKFDSALRYYKQLEDAIVAAVLEADKKLVPARLATGAVELDAFNRNRHTKLQPKPVDRTLAVLRFDDASTGKPLAVVVNFTGHPTSIQAQILKFSADYVGAMKDTVSKELNTACIFMQGASGDMSINKGTNADHVGFGQQLGREVVKLASSLKPAAVEKPSLVVREERFRFDSRVNLKNPVTMVAYSLAFTFRPSRPRLRAVTARTARSHPPPSAQASR
ncbi:MAG: neutral/alkaline non-lysosomal ceramidase N-terminal domain-containing protein [Verrucomicrobia bacterium]|nr:neutral/alkaline non-lysosomal ceramidase N-terminal domain-containing protein [Verrucomicrobiota bacterium]